MTVTFLLWLIIGAMLIVVEIMTGTFYLLIFGLAAWAGAAMSYAGHGLDYQLAGAGVTAVVGLVAVRYLKLQRSREAPASSGDLDVGNDVKIESISGPRLKVQYRGATWDAVLDHDRADNIRVGDIGVICAVRGNVLVIRPSLPATTNN